MNILGLSAAVALTAAAAPVAGETPAETALMKANAEWIAAMNTGRHEQAIAMMADDAALVGAAGPATAGRGDITRFVAGLARVQGFHVDFTLEKVSVAPDGRVGYVYGDSVITRPGADGAPVSGRQRLLIVWRKDAGRWRCYLDVTFPPRP